MKRSLRPQLLLSHLLPVGLMLLALVGAIAGFFQLGHSVDRILKNNYQSVVAAQNMKEALERMDDAATFFLAGQTELARAQYASSRPRFEAAYLAEAHNITEPGESELADSIGRRYAAYRTNLNQLLSPSHAMPADRSRAFYFSTLQPSFSALKQEAQNVLDLNQATILRESARAKAEARHDALMGIIATGATALVAASLAWRQIAAIMTPLVSLTRRAEEIGIGRLDGQNSILRDDEMGVLAVAIDDMAGKLRVARAAYQDRLQRAERMSDAAVENLYDPVLITDADGRVVHLNRAAEGLFGSAEQAGGKYVADVVGEPRITRAVERAVRQEHVSADEGDAALVSIRGASEELASRIYRLRVTPMVTAKGAEEIEGEDAGRLIGAVAVLEDVTYLQEIDRLKTEFIGVASHELRTPVTSLLMSVDLLREGVAGELTPMQREVVDAQKEDLFRLERMMHELLDLTRLESGVQLPRFEIVRPHELAETCRRTLKAQATAKGVALRTEVSELLPGVRADRGQITRVLINLLTNAIRHTETGGVVTLRATAIPDAKAVEFMVKDSGAGIPAAYLPHIFERFVQVPGATKGGAGLGLSIAQTIVHAHGDEIRVSSEMKRGAVFTFRLATV